MSDEHIILEGKVMWAFLNKKDIWGSYGLCLIPNKKSLEIVKKNKFYNYKEDKGWISLRHRESNFNIYDKQNNLIINSIYPLANNSHVKVRCESFIWEMNNEKCLHLKDIKIIKNIKIKSDINWEVGYEQHN